MTDTKKPFVCVEQGCGMSFTNEDHLTVHKKKHDMCLSIAGKHTFIADQTPTPTRFIRYGEEVGLFQDLQNVNPFEEQFKKANDAVKMGETPLQPEPMSGPVDDTLHTPQVLPIRSVQPQTPFKNPGDEHPDIEMDVILPDEDQLSSEHSSSKDLDPMSSVSEAPSEETRKFLPIIQLPDGNYVTLMGEPVQPSTVPSVVIPSSYANVGSVIVDGLSGHTNHHVQPEPIAGPSTYFILPKPGVPVAPPKLSLAKEKLKEKVNKNKVAASNSILVTHPSKPAKVNKTQISENNSDDKNSKKLERNRAAAARFRKKKKHLEHILINKVHELEDKVKELQSENKRITIQMHFYRNESANAKDLLLAHRDCSVTRQLTKSEVIAVVDSSTQLKEMIRVDSTAEVIEVRPQESNSQVPITLRRASTSKAPALTPLMIVRQSSSDGNSVLRYGSSDTVIVENVQRANTD